MVPSATPAFLAILETCEAWYPFSAMTSTAASIIWLNFGRLFRMTISLTYTLPRKWMNNHSSLIVNNERQYVNIQLVRISKTWSNRFLICFFFLINLLTAQNFPDCCLWQFIPEFVDSRDFKRCQVLTSL